MGREGKKVRLEVLEDSRASLLLAVEKITTEVDPTDYREWGEQLMAMHFIHTAEEVDTVISKLPVRIFKCMVLAYHMLGVLATDSTIQEELATIRAKNDPQRN